MGLAFSPEEEGYSHVLSCPSDLEVIGEVDGEGAATIVMIVLMLVTVGIYSSWWSTKKHGRLLLFFAHWLSGFVYQVVTVAMVSMVGGCWVKSRDITIIKIFIFILLTASNMLAVTNLAICINLALIIKDHRNMSRMRSVGTPRRIKMMVAVCVGEVLLTVPFWSSVYVSLTSFYPVSESKVGDNWVDASSFIVDLVVGLCMFFIVAWLLLFRLTELCKCYEAHSRMRYFFALTIIAIATDVAVGIDGVILLSGGLSERGALYTFAFVMRHIHITLDSLVLYGVLGISWSSTAQSNRSRYQWTTAESPSLWNREFSES